MTITTEDIEHTVRPLVYGVRDQDGVTSAIVKFIEQIREADRKKKHVSTKHQK